MSLAGKNYVYHRLLWRLCVGLLLLGIAVPACAAGYAFGVNGLDFSLSSYRLEDNGELRHLGHRPMGKSPPAIVVHPSGRFIFSLSQTAQTIAVSRFNPRNGKLTPVAGSPFSVKARSPFAITFHPSGRFVYVAARFSGVGAYAFDEDTGGLTPLPGSPFPAGERTRSVVMHPSGHFLYAINGYSNSISAYRVDQHHGGLTPLSGSPWLAGEASAINHSELGMEDVPPAAGGIPYDITIDAEGHFIFIAHWAAASVSVFKLDEKSGRPKQVPGSPFFADFNPYRLRLHPNGRWLYIVHYPTNKVSVMDVDAVTGRLTHISGSPFDSGGEGPVAMAFGDEGRRLYVSHYESNEIALLDIAQDSGAPVLRQLIGTRLGPWDLAVIDDVPPKEAGAAQVLVAQGAAGVALFGVDTKDGLVPADKVDSPARLVALSPDGRFAYVADAGQKHLTTLRVTQTGLLPVEGGVVEMGHVPVDLSIDVNGWFLYAINTDDTMLTWYLDPDSGIPRAVQRAPVKTGRRPVAVVQDPASRFTYVVNAGSNTISSFYSYNSTMPVVIEIHKYGSPYAAGTQPVALAVDPNGRYAYVANAGSSDISVFRIHNKIGALSSVPGSPFKTAGRPVDLTVHASGRWLYVANQAASKISIYAIEKGLGALAADVRELKLPVQPQKLWLDATGQTMWVLAKGGRRLLRLAVDAETGGLALLKVEQLKDSIKDLVLLRAESHR